jgi:hypothetical protein
MPDSRLNGAERILQHPFRKSLFFKALVVFTTVMLVFALIRELPNRRERPPQTLAVAIRQAELPEARAPLKLAGAWELLVDDPRFGGLSGLTIDSGRLLAVSDLGAVALFDFPTHPRPTVRLQDLRDGPGPFGKKWMRDAESLARDLRGRGWWVGYEQRHSLWLYDSGFEKALESIDLRRPDWRDNRGAEGLMATSGGLLVTAENGRDAMLAGRGAIARFGLNAGAEVADAAIAPDGSHWLLLRSKGLGGIAQSIAPLVRTSSGYRAGRAMPVPKAPLDNYEGMAIERDLDGGWRFWLITDDGHRLMARTLLVALDYPAHDKSPATSAGLSKKPPAERL